MFFSIQTPHPNISVIRFHGTFKEEWWPAYERAYLELYEKHDRATIVFDLRAISIDTLSSIFPFIMLKKNLMMSLKARTCRMLLAAVILTEHDIVRDLVMQLVKLSGQASLFYAFSNVELATATVARLVAVMNNRRIPQSDPPLLRWKDVSRTHIALLLVAYFIRICRHFLALRAK